MTPSISVSKSPDGKWVFLHIRRECAILGPVTNVARLSKEQAATLSQELAHAATSKPKPRRRL